MTLPGAVRWHPLMTREPPPLKAPGLKVVRPVHPQQTCSQHTLVTPAATHQSTMRLKHTSETSWRKAHTSRAGPFLTKRTSSALSNTCCCCSSVGALTRRCVVFFSPMSTSMHCTTQHSLPCVCFQWGPGWCGLSGVPKVCLAYHGEVPPAERCMQQAGSKGD